MAEPESTEERPLPPPRPGVRHVYVPFYGIVVSDDRVRGRVDKVFHWPMIVLALLVLPLLAYELLEQPQRGSLQWWFSAIGMTIIWFAFVVEFVVKIALAESRVEYVRRNWLDLVIIIVPVLRPLRATAVVRTSRVLKVRGVGLKLLRSLITLLIGLEATDRLKRRLGIDLRAGRRDPTRMTRHQLISEVKRLRRLADAWEAWHESHIDHLDEHGHDPAERKAEEVVPEMPKLEAEQPEAEATEPAAEPTAGGRAERV